MGSREERLALNQETFRSANEGLIEVADVDGDRRIPFLCECADITCMGRVEATIAEFHVVHEDADRYFILPGHQRVEGEDILSENGRYEVVRKA